MVESVLARLGLEGSFQVHRAPVVLAIDERAHQVFEGFDESSWILVLDDLRLRLGGDVRGWGVKGDVICEGLLRDIDHDGVVVVRARRTDHAGGLYGLVWVVDRLVGPGGCPWDIEQTHESLKKYLLEEAYEFIQAVDDGDERGMREELGDVLLQPLMHTQKKRLEGGWAIDDVARGITEKLVRRHPHVFGDGVAEDSAAVLRNWDLIKKEEKSGSLDPGSASVLAGVPVAMPALLKAMEVSKRAARAGFEWPDLEAVWEKFEEETGEVKAAILGGETREIVGEFGDLLFTVVNLARWCGVDAEDALRTMVERFRRRFVRMEELAGGDLRGLSAEDWDRYWEQAKSELAG